jgi:hypothetical protein
MATSKTYEEYLKCVEQANASLDDATREELIGRYGVLPRALDREEWMKMYPENATQQ